jgi:hypothetical protein
MPVDASRWVVGQVKNREGICGSLPFAACRDQRLLQARQNRHRAVARDRQLRDGHFAGRFDARCRALVPWSVVTWPITGDAPTIDVVVGYHKANSSAILKRFLTRIDDLTAGTSG